MFSIFNDVFHTATRQNSHVRPTHWVEQHRAPFSDHHDREAELHRRRLDRYRTGQR